MDLLFVIGPWGWEPDVDNVLHEGTARAGSINSITLDRSASLKIGAYKSALLTITDGTGVGQARTIIEYNAATKLAEIRGTWAVIPDNTSVFKIESASWVAPDDCAGLLDLRSIPQMSLAGGDPEGFGLFALHNSAPSSLGSEYRILAFDLRETLTRNARSLLGDQLRIGMFEETRLDRIIYEMFTAKGDHTGETFARPLMPRTDGALNIGLAGQRVHRERFNHEAVQHQATLRQLRAQFREEKRAAENGERLYRGVPDLVHHRRQLGRRVKELRGIAWEHLVDLEFRTPQNAPEPERTTIIDDYNRPDNDDPGANYTEVDGDWDIVNNEIKALGASSGFPATLRYDGTNLSSSNHYAQIDFTAASTITKFMCGAVRFQPSAETAYFGRIRSSGSASIIHKVVAGTDTGLTSDTNGTGPPHTDKLQVNGNDLELFMDAGSVSTVADTSIPSGTLVGIAAHSSANATGDNLLAEDLEAAVAVRQGWLQE